MTAREDTPAVTAAAAGCGALTPRADSTEVTDFLATSLPDFDGTTSHTTK